MKKEKFGIKKNLLAPHNDDQKSTDIQESKFWTWAVIVIFIFISVEMRITNSRIIPICIIDIMEWYRSGLKMNFVSLVDFVA